MLHYRKQFNTCKNNESPSCLSIVCPSANPNLIDKTCQGYAHKILANGTTACATAGVVLYGTA